MGTAVLVLGLAVVAAPLVIVFARDLMPGAVSVTSCFLPMIQLAAGSLRRR